MATLQVSGNNASYTLTLSGMSTSTRYHVFIADLDSSGSVNGYKCIRSSLGSSSTWTYNGSSNSPYSNYRRSVYVYTSTAATSHSVGTIYTYDEMRSGCTFMDSNTIPAAGGGSTPTYTQSDVYVKVQYGLESVGVKYYQNGYEKNTTITTTGTTILSADQGSSITVTSAASDSSKGITSSDWRFIEYKSNSYVQSNVSKTWAVVGDDIDVTSYTRYIGIGAYGVTLSYNANGGSGAPSSQTGWWDDYLYIDGNTIPTREHYDFLGWSESSAATSPTWTYGQSSGLYMQYDRTLYAVWSAVTYQGDIEYISGGPTYTSGTEGKVQFFVSAEPAYTSGYKIYCYYDSSTTAETTYTFSGSDYTGWIYLDNLFVGTGHTYTLKLYSPKNTLLDTYVLNTRDIPTYSVEFNANGGVSGSLTVAYVSMDSPTYTIPSTATPTRDKYEFLGWSGSSTAVAPSFYVGSTITISGNTVLYAVWKEKPDIALFYWDGADGTNDATLIAKGQPVSNITATRWNNLLAKIKELADAVGVSFSYTAVSGGSEITAARFNVARTGLNNIKTALGTTTALPTAQSSGYIVYASLFTGNGSLKSALNHMIGVYNNG